MPRRKYKSDKQYFNVGRNPDGTLKLEISFHPNTLSTGSTNPIEEADIVDAGTGAGIDPADQIQTAPSELQLNNPNEFPTLSRFTFLRADLEARSRYAPEEPAAEEPSTTTVAAPTTTPEPAHPSTRSTGDRLLEAMIRIANSGPPLSWSTPTPEPAPAPTTEPDPITEYHAASQNDTVAPNSLAPVIGACVYHPDDHVSSFSL